MLIPSTNVGEDNHRRAQFADRCIRDSRPGRCAASFPPRSTSEREPVRLFVVNELTGEGIDQAGDSKSARVEVVGVGNRG